MYNFAMEDRIYSFYMYIDLLSHNICLSIILLITLTLPLPVDKAKTVGRQIESSILKTDIGGTWKYNFHSLSVEWCDPKQPINMKNKYTSLYFHLDLFAWNICIYRPILLFLLSISKLENQRPVLNATARYVSWRRIRWFKEKKLQTNKK